MVKADTFCKECKNNFPERYVIAFPDSKAGDAAACGDEKMKKQFRGFAKKYLESLLNRADITINGANRWDIRVMNPEFYETVLIGGSLALGETYMKGWWECEQLDEFFHRLCQLDLSRNVIKNIPEFYMKYIKPFVLNRQSRKRAFKVGEHHYNAGNDLFEHMLDSSMAYSCGYFKNTDILEEAQQEKLELICRKLHLKAGMRMLDIGCGWGSLALYAAKHYAVEVVGLTVSKEQANFAQKRCKDYPVEIELTDYRNHTGSYDAVASVGMFEHVGFKNYNVFMETVRNVLRDDGLFLLHTIGANETVFACDPWFDKYIFPNGMLPSIKQIGAAIADKFIMEDWQNMGPDYYKTLLCWYNNFKKSWKKIESGYSRSFYRMWEYYLLSCAGAFRAREMQLWQVVFSKFRRSERYDAAR